MWLVVEKGFLGGCGRGYVEGEGEGEAEVGCQGWRCPGVKWFVIQICQRPKPKGNLIL